MENTNNIMYVLVINGCDTEMYEDYSDVETRICEYVERYDDKIRFEIYQTTRLPWRAGEAHYTPNITYFDSPKK